MISDQDRNKLHEKTYVVYIHTAPNGKKYIGQTGKRPEARWKRGEGYRRHHPHFYAAIQKYGWDNFTHEIVADRLTKEEADRMEADLISKHQSTDRKFGYNVAHAANGPGKHSEDTKRKISTTLKGRTRSPEFREKMSALMMGRTPPPKSEAGLRAIVEFNTGRHPTEETREKLRKSHLGHVATKETKEKMRQAMKGRRCDWCNVGVAQKDKTTGAVIARFERMKDAERETGVACANISAVCRGKRKTAGGFLWEYIGGGQYH